MSDFDWDGNDYEAEEIPQGPKALRDLYGRTRKENDELKGQLASLTARVRQQEVSQLFTSKGLPEKAVGLFPKDVDPTEENISKFVSDYGDLFGQSPTRVEPASPAQNVNAEAQEQFRQMTEVTQNSVPSTMTPLEELKKALENPNLINEMPFDQYKELMRRAGAKV